MRTHELLREGEWTKDRRRLIPHTVTWGEKVPVIARGLGDEGHIVGRLTNIRREGHTIYGDTDVTIGENYAFTCDVSFSDAYKNQQGIEIADGRLTVAYVNEKKFYPWHDTTEGGEADGG